MPQIAVRRFLDRAFSVRILVAGDVMLDAYIAGSALRISPEAPVPVVAVSGRRYLPGGAANVAANILALGSRVSLAGVTGVDESAVRLRRELDRPGVVLDALVEDATRLTTTKTRITAGGQQIVRFDDEDRSPLSESTEALLRARCEDLLSGVDACVISDYAKGVVGDSFCRWLIGEAVKRHKPVVVDPKSRDLARYRGATVVTPNLKETSRASGESVRSSGDLVLAAGVLLPKIAPSALLVTRGEEGMSLFEQHQTVRHLPALRNEVADVTGAGDTVAGVLAIALGLGFSLPDAASIANIAAGVAVGHHGTWAVQPEELLEAAARIDLSSPDSGRIGVNRGLFLDRDGTVIEECGYLSNPAFVRLLPGAAEALAALASQGWKLIVVGNQSGVGRGLITPGQMEAVQRRFLDLMQSNGIPIADSYFCTHAPADQCRCRKPSPFFLERAALEHALDLGSSYMVGDRESDILCGRDAGCSTIWLRNDRFPVADDLPTFVANDWSAIHRRLSAALPSK